VGAAPEGLLGMTGRRKAVGRLDDPREQRTLREGQLTGRLCEVELAGRFDAVPPVAEVHLVRVEGEDFLFREAALDLEGEDRLLHIPFVRLVRLGEQAARELLVIVLPP
jgi:hypothetical protein